MSAERTRNRVSQWKKKSEINDCISYLRPNKSGDGRLAKALHSIIEGGNEDGCGDEYGGKQYGGINSCIVFYVGIR